jgi:hypothetical protein
MVMLPSIAYHNILRAQLRKPFDQLTPLWCMTCSITSIFFFIHMSTIFARFVGHLITMTSLHIIICERHRQGLGNQQDATTQA